MSKSAKFLSLGLILCAFVLALPGQAHAQRYLASQDSFINAARGTTDTSLVPGGIVRYYLNTMGAIGVRGIGTDTLNQLTVLLVKPAGSVPFSNIVDTVSVFVDGNNNAVYEASDVTLVGNMSAGTFGADTALYTLGGAAQVLRQIGAATESYVVVIRTRNDLHLADTRFQVQFKVGQGGQLWTDGLFSYNSIPTDSDKYFPEFVFKVYNDSTANAVQTPYTQYIHQDSSVSGQRPITLFQGRIYSETRTVGGDSLARIGVHFGGSAGANVDSAWAIVGSSERRVDLARTSGSHWGAVNITTIPLGLAGNGWDTFRIVGTVDSPALQSWAACTIPIDSIATRFRRGNAAVIDSSGLTIFTRPRVAVTDSAMGPVAMHPDSRVNYHVLLESFAINADTLLLSPLTHDSITSLGFAIRMTGTMRYTDIDTVQVVIGNNTTVLATPLVAGYTLPDSWSVVLNDAISGTTTVQVYVRLRETAPVDATFRFALHPDSLTTRLRQAGPSSELVGSRIVTVNKPRVAVTDSAMGNISVHPDSRVNYHVLLESFAINADTLLTSPLVNDTVTSLGFAIHLTGGMRSADIDTVQVVVANSTSVLAVLQPAGAGLPDSWLANLSSAAFTGTASIQVYVRLRETAPVDATLRFFLPADSIHTQFRLIGPSPSLLGSRTVTVNKPRVAVTSAGLTSIAVHPDSRVNYHVLLDSFAINADTLLTPALSHDSLTSFGFGIRMNGMRFADIDTVQVVVGNSTSVIAALQPAAAGLPDSWLANISAGDISGTTSVQIYVRLRETAPVDATLRAYVPVDSIVTRFRVAGPSPDHLGSRIVTVNKPQVRIVDTLATNITVHPDTRIQDSFILMAGFIQRDTLTTPAMPDSILSLVVRCSVTQGLTFAHIDTVLLQLNDTVYVSTGNDGVDSFRFVLPSMANWVDTLTYRVYVKTNNNAPANGQIRGAFPATHALSVYRLAGGSDTVWSSRIVTIQKPRITVTDTLTGHINVHPDSRITDSFLLMAGALERDTFFTPHMPDSLTSMTIGCSMTTGFNYADLDTVILWLNGTSHVNSKNNGRDSFTFDFASPISWPESMHYRVYVRTKETAPVDGRIQGFIRRDSVFSAFRLAGPSQDTIFSARVVSIVKPRVAVTGATLADTHVHPDSRIIYHVLLDSFVINADTLLNPALPRDSVTGIGFGIRLNGMRSADIDTVQVVVGNNTTVIASLLPAGAGLPDSWQANIAPFDISGTTTIQVYVRLRETAPVNATLRLYVPTDSITTRFRVSGPSPEHLGARTVTVFKPRIYVTDTLTGHINVHPDSRITDSFLLMAGALERDTLFVPHIPDSLTSMTIGCSMTPGFNYADLDTVILWLNGTSHVNSKNNGRDSFTFDFASPISWPESMHYRVYVRTKETAPVDGRIQGFIRRDSVFSTFRLAGPSQDTIFSARVVSIVKPRVAVTGAALADTHVHPDSRIIYHVLLDSFAINADTLLNPTLSRDSVTAIGFGIRLNGMRSADIDTVQVVVGNNTTVIASLLPAGAGLPDSWQANIAPFDISGTTTIQVYVRLRETAPVNGTLRLYVPTDSITTRFRVAGPSPEHFGARTVTVFKPRIYVTDTLTGHINVHPDSRVSDSFLLMAGALERDTLFVPHIPDSLTSVTIGCSMTSGFNYADLDTVILWLNGTSYVNSANNARDSFTFNFATPINWLESMHYRVYVRTKETAPVDGRIQGFIRRDSVFSTFRVAGPSQDTVFSARVVTIVKQQVILAMQTLANQVAHPDTRAHDTTMLRHDTIIAASGTILADTLSGISRDTIVTFGIRATLGNGLGLNDIDSFALVIDNTETFRAVHTAGDSWRFTVNKQITNASNFRVYVTFRETAPTGGTVHVAVPIDSITTVFRRAGPASDTHSTGIVTDSRPMIQAFPTFLATAGNDSINPIVAFTTPVKVYDARFYIDTSLIGAGYDTMRGFSVIFTGPARDSVYNAAISFTATGAWVGLTKIAADTWVLAPAAGLDSRVRTGDTIAVRINVADTASPGEWLAARLAYLACTGTWQANGPAGSGHDSSGVFLIDADPVRVVMDILGDTRIPPWAQLRSTDTLLVCSGTIYTNVGPVAMPVYDTMTSFGVYFDSGAVRLSADSIAGCTLILFPHAGASSYRRITLETDATDRRLWKLSAADSRTYISETQPFQVWALIRGDRRNIAETISVRIMRDSVNTIFTTGLAGDTHSSRNVLFSYPDTVQVIQDTTYTDTNVNPDSRSGDNPFIIFAGRIQGDTGHRYLGNGDSGQQYFPQATDSLTYFGIRILSPVLGINSADSVQSVTMYLGAMARPVVLTRGWAIPDGFGANSWHWSTQGSAVDSRLAGVGPNDTFANTDTFIVKVTMYETVALGINYRITAELFSDSVRTYFMGDSGPYYGVVGSRKVTFTKPTYQIAALPLGDTIVSPFPQQNETIVAFVGRFAVTQVPSDTLTAFQIRLLGSTNFRGESVTVHIIFDSGTHTPGRETIPVLLDAQSSTPRYALASMPVDTNQSFSIRLTIPDTRTPANALKLIGETVQVIIDSTSVTTAVGLLQNISCSRIIRWNYVDTIVLADFTPGDTTIHPDSRARINPVIVYQGSVRPQLSRAALTDTLQRFGVRFTGSAVNASGDSVRAAWVQLGTAVNTFDTWNLARSSVDGWSINLDSPIAFGSVMYCTVYAQVFETVQLGATLRATIPSDSISTYFTADTATHLVNRTITFAKPALVIDTELVSDTRVSPWRELNDSTLVLTARVASSFTLYDTITKFGVLARTTTGLFGESFALYLQVSGGPASTDTNVRLTPTSQGLVATYFVFNSPILIDSGVTLRVRAMTHDSNPAIFLGRSLSVVIPPDSIATALTARSNAETLGCVGTVYYNYIDTVQITNDVLVDTNIHPDSRAKENPVVAMRFSIRGQVSTLNAADTLRYIRVRFEGTAVGTNDSVASCSIVLNPGINTDSNTAFALQRLDTNLWQVALDSRVAYNQTISCTLHVRVFETVVLGRTIRAVLDSGAVRTTLTAASETAVHGRWITLGKPRFQIAMASMVESSIVPVWRAQKDSVMALSGRFTVTYTPTDSLTLFNVAMQSNSRGIRGESVMLWLRLDSSLVGPTPAMDTYLVRSGNDSNALWALQQPINIDSWQSWSVWVVPYDTPVRLTGETAVFFIPSDSAQAALTDGKVGNLTCSSVIRWNFVDTVLITDTALGDTTIHPDSRMLQNPFLMFRGAFRGQRYKAALNDTMTRLTFRFNGTAVRDVTSGPTIMQDSVTQAWIVMNNGDGAETRMLSRVDSDAWGTGETIIRLYDTHANTVHVDLFVRVAESVTLGATMWAEVSKDSVHIYYCNDTPLLGGADYVRLSRTVTFGVPVATTRMDTMASLPWVHPVLAQGLRPLYLLSRGQESNPVRVMSGVLNGDYTSIGALASTGDTLKIFTVNLVGSASGISGVTACTLVLHAGAGDTAIQLTKLSSVAGLETWGHLNLDYGFRLPDSTSESFSVWVRVSETIPHVSQEQGCTLFAMFPAHGLKTQYRDTGPGASWQDSWSRNTVTFRRDSMYIHSENRAPWLSSVIEGGDTREVMWFVPKSDVEADTLHSLTILLKGSTGATQRAAIDTVLLYRDVNRNRQWDSWIYWPNSNPTPGDSLVGYFRPVDTAAETWVLVHYTDAPFGTHDATFKTDTLGQTTDTAEYLVVVRVLNTNCTNLTAVIPALGADGWYTESGPYPSAVSYNQYFIGMRDDSAPITPPSLTVDVQAGAMVLTFEPSPSGDSAMQGGLYAVFFDQGAGIYPTTFLKSFTHVSGQLSYSYALPDTSITFNPDSQYRFVLVCQDSTGNKSAASPVVSATFRSSLSPAARVSASMVSPSSGDFVYFNRGFASNRINLVAKLADRLTATQVTKVEFQVRRVTDVGPGFSLVAIALDSSFDGAGEVYYSAQLESSALLRDSAFVDSYEVRAVAYAGASNPDTYATSISFILVTDTRFATYVSVFGDSRAEADSVHAEQVITTRSNEDVIALRTPTGAFDVVLRLNRGSLLTDTARMMGQLRRGGIPDTWSNALKAVGLEVLSYWANFTMQLTQSTETNLASPYGTITINYIDVNNDGIDDSSFVDMTKCKIYTINASGQAELLENITLDRTRRTLTGTVKHFSPFFVTNDTGTNAAGLNRLLVGPNPYRPNDGNPQTGRPWVAGDATTGIMFKNLPNAVRIEIFTILGERVIEMNKNDANATISWSGKNQDGRDVASGYYLYVVTDLTSGQRVTGKIAVIR